MVHEGRTDLTEAIVTWPGRPVLFYGCHLLEGLNLGEAREATYTLSGIIAWVGKQAQKGTLNLGVLVTLSPFPLYPCHSNFIVKTCPCELLTIWQMPNDGRCPSSGLKQDSRCKATCHSKAGTKVWDNGSYGWPHPSCPRSCQTMDLRVTEAQCQPYHQCPQCLRG